MVATIEMIYLRPIGWSLALLKSSISYCLESIQVWLSLSHLCPGKICRSLGPLPSLESGRWLSFSPLPHWQVIVWGDYGRMDHKCFMGMAQIMLDELDLSAAVTGWYKLFPTSSVADSTLGSLTRRLSQSSLESATSPSCS